MRTLLIIVLSVVIIVALESLYYGVRFLVRQRSETLRRRLQDMGKTGAEPTSFLRQGRLAATATLDAVLRKMPLARRTERLLEAADSSLTVARVWALTAGLGVVALAIGLSARLALLPLAVLVLGAPAAPLIMLLVNASRRSTRLSEQLPEALDMMARSLRAGHAMSGALQLVATEMPKPVGIEFARVFEEQRLGLPLDEAIVHMTQRMPANRDLKIVAVSTLIQKETGGNLAEILGGIAETIRARFRFQGKLAGITAEGRASAVVLGALPLVFAAILQFINPKYLDPLFETAQGRWALAYAGVSWFIGLAVLYRMAKVDY